MSRNTSLQEAKASAVTLSDALKNNGLEGRGVAAQRKDLKRTYLRLLLLCPFTNESQETETHLWITTSHAFISVYKQRLTELDRIQGTHSHAPGNERGQNGHGPVEYRKVLTRFRQFLSEEEVFWKLFVIRLRSISPEDNLNKALLSLDLTPGALEGNGILDTVKSMFPPEQEPLHQPTLTAEEQTVRMNLVGKALVCLGDLARYREQYNEGNNRPRAGREDGPPAQRGGHRGRGRGRGQGRGGAIVERTARERDYTLAQRYYETAQRLIPSDGNASHQLAILASYKRDSFASLVHYIRSLCVTHPYVPGADNMASMLKKALDAWKVKQKDGRGKVADDPDMLPKDRAARLKDNIVVLHGFWKFGGDKNERVLLRLSQDIVNDFVSLVSERNLLPPAIMDVFVVAHGGLWQQRAVLSSTDSSERSSRLVSPPLILMYILNLHRALWDRARKEVRQGAKEDATAQGLEQNITATLRRMVETLRLTVVWTQANSQMIQNIIQDLPSGFTLSAEKRLMGDLRKFWQSFASFVTVMETTFPRADLPTTASALPEDVRLKGFLPFVSLPDLDALQSELASGLAASEETTSQLHPNEEHLVRIADLLTRAHALVDLSIIPVQEQDGHFTFEEDFLPSTAAGVAAPINEAPDVNTNNVVRATLDASRHIVISPIIEEDSDSDEEQIVWNPRDISSPVVQAVEPSYARHATSTTGAVPQKIAQLGHVLSSPGMQQATLPARTTSHEQVRSKPIPPPPRAGVTAFDLLESFQTGGRPPPTPSAPLLNHPAAPSPSTYRLVNPPPSYQLGTALHSHQPSHQPIHQPIHRQPDHLAYSYQSGPAVYNYHARSGPGPSPPSVARPFPIFVSSPTTAFNASIWSPSADEESLSLPSPTHRGRTASTSFQDTYSPAWMRDERAVPLQPHSHRQ